MRLRNKKTGEIVKIELIKSDNNGNIVVYTKNSIVYNKYKSLNDFLNDWEDYKPTEPLIKDEKIRKAVRVWADANDFEPDYEFAYYSNCYKLYSWQADIDFNTPIKGLEDEVIYTLIELCGEA